MFRDIFFFIRFRDRFIFFVFRKEGYIVITASYPFGFLLSLRFLTFPFWVLNKLAPFLFAYLTLTSLLFVGLLLLIVLFTFIVPVIFSVDIKGAVIIIAIVAIFVSYILTGSLYDLMGVN